MKRKPVALIALILAIGLMGAGFTGNAGGGENETKTAHADKKKLRSKKQECVNTHKAVEFYRQTTWKWQKLNSVTPTKASERQLDIVSCAYAKWVAKLWQKRSFEARMKYEKWVKSRTIPVTNDWTTAVLISQRVFPKTAGWLMSCSSHEGGHGGFVMNSQGSGAGGWMQFMASTYYANHDDAQRYVKSQGFIVDPRVWTWTHPLGQALTAAYMRAVQGTSHLHWAPSIDPYCY